MNFRLLLLLLLLLTLVFSLNNIIYINIIFQAIDFYFINFNFCINQLRMLTINDYRHIFLLSHNRNIIRCRTNGRNRLDVAIWM